MAPFEVAADPADSYEALNTNGVTGTNRSIRSLSMTMNVYTRTFIDEINATECDDRPPAVFQQHRRGPRG